MKIMLYLIAKLAQGVSTASFFWWLTRMTFGENLALSSLRVDSSEVPVSCWMMLTLPGNCSKWASNLAFLALFISLSAWILPRSSSPTSPSPSSLTLTHLSLMCFSSAVKKKQNSGSPNLEMKVRNASSVSWRNPSKMNLALPAPA